MGCFRLLFDHLAWKEHQFLSDIRDSRKVESLWGMMRGVGGVRKPMHQSWLAKGLGLGLLCWGFKGVQEEISWEEASTLQIGSVEFPPGHAPVLNSILVRDYLTKMGNKTVPQCPYSLDLALCDLWLFPKLRGCRYETIEEMKEAVTKVIDTLTQEDFRGTFQKLLERYKCHAVGGDYFEGDKSFMCVLSIKVPIRKKSQNYLMTLVIISLHMIIWFQVFLSNTNNMLFRNYLHRMIILIFFFFFFFFAHSYIEHLLIKSKKRVSN